MVGYLTLVGLMDINYINIFWFDISQPAFCFQANLY